MNDAEFETTVTRLFDNAPAAPGEEEFLSTLETRRLVDKRFRVLWLTLVGALGALATTGGMILSGSLPFTSLAELPSQFLNAASQSWVVMTAVFLVCGRIAQRISERG